MFSIAGRAKSHPKMNLTTMPTLSRSVCSGGKATPYRLARVGHDIRWPSLTENEVERAIFKSNPDKAPGPDDISFRVWREL